MYYNQQIAEIRRLKQIMINELTHYMNYGAELDDLDFHTLVRLCEEILPIEEE